MSPIPFGTTRTFALCLALFAGSAFSATVTIEPDKFQNGQDLSGLAPGATLSTMRYDGQNYFWLEPVYSITGGSWTPTGTRVFGHASTTPSEPPHQWQSLIGAYNCLYFPSACGFHFYFLRVDFTNRTREVEFLTTMRGEQAIDPIDLWAFDANKKRLLKCRVHPVDPTVLQTGVMPAPVYYDYPKPGPGARCGTVIAKKNCVGPQPGNCDFVISAKVIRREQDISFVWFGGLLWQNTWAPADRLTYSVP
jgi:hypothetical protein